MRERREKGMQKARGAHFADAFYCPVFYCCDRLIGRDYSQGMDAVLIFLSFRYLKLEDEKFKEKSSS